MNRTAIIGLILVILFTTLILGSNLNNIYEPKSDKAVEALIEPIRDKKKIVYYFGAKWCGPCKIMKPRVKEIAKENRGLYFIFIDIDRCPDTRKAHNILVVPSLLIDGAKIEGTHPEIVIRDFIKKETK